MPTKVGSTADDEANETQDSTFVAFPMGPANIGPFMAGSGPVVARWRAER